MKTVPLSGKKAAGRVALVDDEDYALVMTRTWHIWEDLRRRSSGGPYAINTRRRDGSRVATLMHTLITGWPRTDHANHDGLDNRRQNLRPASQSQNLGNQRIRPGRGTSRYKGVYWHRDRRKWTAQIMIDGRSYHLGLFIVEEEAACAYDAAASAAWGEYACLNFPVLPIL